MTTDIASLAELVEFVEGQGKASLRRRRGAFNDLEDRFPLPAWTEHDRRRHGKELYREVLAGFYSRQDPGRDVRVVMGDRNRGRDRYLDLRIWLKGRSTPTRNGLRLDLLDWPAFAELVSIVSKELATRGLVPDLDCTRTQTGRC